MSRRRVVASVSAIMLLAIGVAIVGGVAAFTQTAIGRERLRALAMTELSHVIHGRLYIGRVSGNLFTNISVDSLEIVDPEGFILLASGPISARYDPRDILDRRILVQRISVQRPYVQLIHHRDDSWNFSHVLTLSPGRHTPARGFGDYVVLDSVDVKGAALQYSAPWDPDDTLRIAQRDSQIAAVMRDPAHGVSRWTEGLMRTLSFTNVNFRGPFVRIADPDSVGLGFQIAHLDVNISDPPFRFRSARGHVRIIGDTAFAALPHVEMLGSVAHGGGKAWWGRNRPLAYALHFVGDTVSLDDIAWVYPTLPHTGGGRATIDIRSQRNPHVIDYRLTNIDVRTTESRLRGTMMFTVGGPTLAIRDVGVQADPVDFALIRALSGKPFPYDWEGYFTGFVRGPGGPLPRFRADTVDLTLHDAHVPGALSRAAGSGELDILNPGQTAFHDFHLTLHRLDLRTPEYVNPDLGHLQGTVAGTATLDSTWNDVRFRDADLTHYDGDGDPTRVIGHGHITLGDGATTYSIDVRADPVAFSTLARSYPDLWLRGSFSGPLTVTGTLADMAVSTSLDGDAGTIGFEGNASFEGPVHRASGTVTLDHADLRAVAGRSTLPQTDLTARLTGDYRGSSLSTSTGQAAVSVDRSTVYRTGVTSARARLRFGEGHLSVDTMRVESAAGSLDVTSGGGLGLATGVTDSLAFTLVADSLGGLRRFLMIDTLARDTLGGTLRVAATAGGRLDSLSLSGTLDGANLRSGGTHVRTLASTFNVADVLGDARGTAHVDLDGAGFAHGIAFDSATIAAIFQGRGRAQIAVTGASPNGGPHGAATGEVVLTPARRDLTVDTFALYTQTNAWHLAGPARAHSDSAGLVIEPLTVRAAVSGSVTLHGVVPVSGSSLVRLIADSVPLADIGTLVQASSPWGGLGSLDWTVIGPRESPTMRMDGRLSGAQFGDLHLQTVLAHGAYDRQRLQLHGDLLQRGDTTVHALVVLPIDLALVSMPHLAMDDSLSGNVHADSTMFGALATIFPTLRNPKGRFLANVDIGGTPRHPTLNGDIRVSDAEAGFSGIGVRLVKMNADLHLTGDSLAIRNVSAATVTQDRQGRALLRGWLTFADPSDPRFDVTLTASAFHALNKARLADLEVTVPPDAPLHLVGQETRSRLSGSLQVVRGSIFIPDISQKQVINLDDPEFFNVVDTSLLINRELLPAAPPRLVQGLTLDNVSVTLGQDVWLKSSEANINLSTAEGPLTVTTAPTGRDASRALTLAGTLVATRGDYRLDLGLVQRTFIVDQPGTLRFTGGPELNPELDISAIHTVRQPQSNAADVKPELSIRVRLGGTLERPTVTLSSADSLQQLSQSDLVSYLVTGQQSFDVGNGTNTSALTSVFLPTLGTALGSQLSGGLFDYVQVQTGGYSQLTPTAQSTLWGSLSGSRIGAGKQIGDRTFVSADLGVCQLGGGGASTPTFADQIGVRVEHQLTSHFSIAGASEPATTALYCGNAISRSFVATPRQWGLDLFHTWQF
jgi:translocation and assembly module TamB